MKGTLARLRLECAPPPEWKMKIRWVENENQCRGTSNEFIEFIWRHSPFETSAHKTMEMEKGIVGGLPSDIIHHVAFAKAKITQAHLLCPLQQIQPDSYFKIKQLSRVQHEGQSNVNISKASWFLPWWRSETYGSASQYGLWKSMYSLN